METPAFVTKAKLVLIKSFMVKYGLANSTAWVEFFIKNDRLFVEACSAGGAKAIIPPVNLADDNTFLSSQIPDLCAMFTQLLGGSPSTYQGAIERYLKSGKVEGYKVRMYVNGQTSHARV